jgi:hypothetical protein
MRLNEKEKKNLKVEMESLSEVKFVGSRVKRCQGTRPLVRHNS